MDLLIIDWLDVSSTTYSLGSILVIESKLSLLANMRP